MSSIIELKKAHIVSNLKNNKKYKHLADILNLIVPFG